MRTTLREGSSHKKVCVQPMARSTARPLPSYFFLEEELRYEGRKRGGGPFTKKSKGKNLEEGRTLEGGDLAGKGRPSSSQKINGCFMYD